jgi:SAM-dependent methyltransferase
MREWYERLPLDRYYGADDLVRFIPPDAVMGRVLNVGCGPNTFSAGCCAVGVDFNTKLIPWWAEAKRRCVAADVERLPFADGAFDWTISNDFLEHVVNAADVMRELKRVARKGWHRIDTKLETYWRSTEGGTLHVSAGEHWEQFGTCESGDGWHLVLSY